jgi:glycosyltransferase involved in cell wall biosynthesis
LWDQHSQFIPKRKGEDIKKWINRIAQHALRIWDRTASQRVDEFVAISGHVQKRIAKYYKRDSKIIYPPLPQTFERLTPKQVEEKDFYLIVSRLYKHKNIDVAIEAFNKLNKKLIIIGDGPMYKNYKSQIINPKIKLLGQLSDQDVVNHYAACRAFIMPQEEDFGLTPIEAMYFGKPVLALRKGGAVETIIEGEMGEFFDDPIPEALADGVRRLDENYDKYDKEFIKNHSLKFSTDNFKNNILSLFE